jgi:hypothetical protein
MSNFTPEKKLRHVNSKIKQLEKNSNFLKKEIVKVILIGIIFSLLAPMYRGEEDISGSQRDSALERMDGNYLNTVLLAAGVYISFCLLGHFIWGIQDRKKMKYLLERKSKIEQNS